ncbi:hypothetical protein JOM56_005502 [Amanita muscaria]
MPIKRLNMKTIFFFPFGSGLLPALTSLGAGGGIEGLSVQCSTFGCVSRYFYAHILTVNSRHSGAKNPVSLRYDRRTPPHCSHDRSHSTRRRSEDRIVLKFFTAGNKPMGRFFTLFGVVMFVWAIGSRRTLGHRYRSS